MRGPQCQNFSSASELLLLRRPFGLEDVNERVRVIKIKARIWEQGPLGPYEDFFILFCTG